MKIKKGALAGVAAGITLIIVSTILFFALSSWTLSLYQASAAVWKPMEPLSRWVGGLYAWLMIEGIILGIAYSVIHVAIPGSGLRKGLNYGALLWILVTIPGMAMTYLFFAVPNALILDWLAEGLVSYLIAGAVLAKVYDKVD